MGLFGSISKALFGKKEPQTSESGNRFADQINTQFSPMAAQGAQGMGAMANIMGLGGPGARSDALEGWWDSSGGDFMLNQGMDDVDAFYRAKGLGQSGATMKGIEDYRSGLASTKMGEGMGFLGDISRLGLGAGGLVSSAGQYSEGTGAHKSGGGLGKVLGLVSSILSDRRLKTNIEKVGELPDGLGVYDYDYIPAKGPIAAFMPPGRQRGVMAGEVAQLRPWALGPEIDGFQTVRYDLLEAA